MKVLLISAALLAVTLAEAPQSQQPAGPYPAASGPYPPSGWRPSGRLLVLPARQQTSTVYGPPPQEYGPPPQEYGPPPTTEPTTESTSDQPTEQPENTEEGAQESERLVDRGVYYVLQNNGKLQEVRYSTGPLRAEKQIKQKSQFQNKYTEASSNFDSQRVKPEKFQQQKQERLTAVQAHAAQFQPQASQFAQQKTQQPGQAAQFNQQPQPFHFVEIQKSQEIHVNQPQAPEGFVANVQYRDVEPISAPVYTFNPNPLVRILKK